MKKYIIAFVLGAIIFSGISGVAYKDDYSGLIQFPHTPPTIEGSISLIGNRNTIDIMTGMDRSSYTNTYVTLQYTKTTDLSS